MAIVYRVLKGIPLTNAEVDANFLHLDTIKANKEITVTGTNGLTGGGNLSANRTLALGTPSTLTTTSTNSSLISNGTSHTHALDLSGREIIAGNGLVGGGDLGSDRTVTLGTPSTLTATSTNSSLISNGTSHTHNIEATASRTSSSTTALLIAGGMNAHRTSTDHDNRYAPANTVALKAQTLETLGGNFGSRQVLCTRSGNVITVQMTGSMTNLPSQQYMHSNDGAIPPAYRPPNRVHISWIANEFLHYTAYLEASGRITVMCRNPLNGFALQNFTFIASGLNFAFSRLN